MKKKAQIPADFDPVCNVQTVCAMLAGVHEDMRNPPTQEMVTSWTETAITNLQTEYGTAGAGQALQDARAYVAQHPGLPDLLESLGLGSHPRVVALAAAKGRAARLAGKMKG